MEQEGALIMTGEVAIGRRHAAVALVAIMTMVAATEWRVVFGWPDSAPLVLTAIAAVGTTVLSGSPRRPLALTGTVSLVALLVVFVVLGSSSPAPASVLDGLLHGWSRILSTTLQSPTTEGRMLLPAGIVWAAGYVSAETALRVRAWPTSSVIPPMLAYAAALPFGVGGGSPLSSVALLVTASATVLVLSPPPVFAGGTSWGGTSWHGSAAGARNEPPRLSRQAAGAVGLVVVASGGGLLAGLHLPFGDGVEPYDPRSDQRPPLEDVETVDPLSLLAGWALDSDDQVLFTATGPTVDRWRLAVLDRYDPGIGWSSAARYVAVGNEVPPKEIPDTVAAPGPNVAHAVTIGELGGVWLPTTGHPEVVTEIDVHVDPATTMLVHGDGLAPGLRYRVESAPGEAAEDCAIADDPVAPPPTGEGAVLTGELIAYATAITRGAPSQCAQAEMIEAYLRSDRFTFSAEAPSGTTLARTIELLKEGDSPKAGTSEQFSTAFALLARASGMDVRVVVGFRPGEEVGNAHRVHASDAYAWAEVRFDQLGWVSFNPTPDIGEDRSPSEVTIPPAPSTTATTETPATTASTSTTAPTTADAGEQCATGCESDEGFALPLAMGIVIPALAVGTPAVITLVRRQRRASRRRQPVAVDQVVGAWRQVLVDLQDGGLRLAETNTASDYVEQAKRSFGPRLAAELDYVAELANRALFNALATDEDAVRAWSSADRLAALLKAQRSSINRLRYAFDVRALVRS